MRYDGRSVESSPLIAQIDKGFMDSYKKIVVSPNGRYLTYAGSNRAFVFDLQDNNKLIKSTYDAFEDFAVTDKGDLYGVNNFRVLLLRNNGEVEGDEPIAAETSSLTNGKPCQLYLNPDDGYVYLVGGSKVQKTLATEFKWTECVSLKGNIKLEDAAISRGGIVFGYIGRDNAGNRLALLNIRSESPSLYKKLKTGITYNRQPLEVEVVSNVFADSNSNFWMLDGFKGCYIIYNPRGIRGLKKVRGNLVTHQK